MHFGCKGTTKFGDLQIFGGEKLGKIGKICEIEEKVVILCGE